MRGPSEGGGPPRAAIQRGPCPKVPAEFDRRPLAGARGRLRLCWHARQIWRTPAPHNPGRGKRLFTGATPANFLPTWHFTSHGTHTYVVINMTLC